MYSIQQFINENQGTLIASRGGITGQLVYNGTMIELKCPTCRETYSTYPSRVKSGKAKTCGKRDCRYGTTKIANNHLIVTSPTYGSFKFTFSERHAPKLRGLGGMWYVSIKRGNPYAQHHIGDKVMELQRFLSDDPKGKYVDHINRDTLDNRDENLRVCSNADNLRNGNTRPNNTSGYKGVWWSKRASRWNAEIKVNYKKIVISGFKNFSDALGARIALEMEYWSAYV